MPSNVRRTVNRYDGEGIENPAKLDTDRCRL